jgi:pyruvate formate lyase activating enzyme
VTVEQLVREVKEDLDFFKGTGGGVTFSGGEPMAQADFVMECAARFAEEQIHVAVETAGCFPSGQVPQLAERADLVLFDLKHTDGGKLSSVLGVDGRSILGNLDALLVSRVALELRLTLIPGFNTSPEELRILARWLCDRPRAPAVTLHPFDRLAAAKARLYGAAYAYAGLQPMGDRDLEAAAKRLEDHGVVIARR